MDASGLFTVLGIFIAIFSLISEEKRLDFILRFSWISWFLSIVLGLATLIFLYSNVIIEILKVLGIKPFQVIWGFDDKMAVLTCAILMSILFIYQLFGVRLPKSRFKFWNIRSEKLLKHKKYSILGFLLEKYLDQFLEILTKESKYEKMYNSFSSEAFAINPTEFLDENFEYLKSPIWSENTKRQAILKMISKPKKTPYISDVETSISRLLKSSDFINYLTVSYPAVPIKLVSCPSFLKDDEFTDSFFKILISNKESPLYRELKDNQHYIPSKGYHLEPENYILRHFFLDCQKAIDAIIWQPIGNYICKYIKEQKGEDNFYNTYDESFSYSDERWNCTIFVGVEFFNVMVTSSIYQKKQDHMWLMYYEYFLNEILKNIDRSKNSEDWQEFPLKFDYLIYKLISNCSDWVNTANYLYNDEVNSILAIEYASECLGQMIRKLLLSDKFTENKKVYYLEIILKLMKDLDSNGHVKLSQKIYFSMIGVTMFSSGDSDLSWLKNIYRDVDHVLRLSGSTFNTEIKKAP